MKRIILGVLLLSLMTTLTSCSQVKPRTVERSIYYWRSSFSLNKSEYYDLQSLKIQRIYLKFFDVIWEGKPIPEAEIRFKTKPSESLDIVPTIFITNSTIKNLAIGDIKGLAEKIGRKTLRIAQKNLAQPIAEIQLDCDWTASTREKYFLLLKEIQELFLDKRIKVSTTIRLHQVKFYQRTGVPPVERGILMTYNVAPVNEIKTRNSIFDITLVKDYTRHIGEYPIDLDVALPIFSWGVVFQDNRFIGLINNIGIENFQNKQYFQRRSGHLIDVIKDTEVKGFRLYHGDTVRFESADSREVLAVSKYLSQKIRSRRIKIVLYHFDDLTLRRTGYAEMEKFFTAFNR